MEYLKPVYKVVEIEYISVVTQTTPENEEPIETNTNTFKRLFKVMSEEHFKRETPSWQNEWHPFDQNRCEISKELLAKFESNEKRYEEYHYIYTHTTIIYLSHIVVC
jgi:hypothetical protein